MGHNALLRSTETRVIVVRFLARIAARPGPGERLLRCRARIVIKKCSAYGAGIRTNDYASFQDAADIHIYALSAAGGLILATWAPSLIPPDRCRI
jgi:hypothetical protein